MQLEETLRGLANRLGHGQHKLQCPICGPTRKKKNEKTLSLKIEDDEAVYRCWHCDADGHVFLQDMFKSFHFEARKMTVAKNISTKPLTSDAEAWLRERGISKETAKKAGVTYGKHYINSIGEETDCLFFPYKNNGHTYASKIRSMVGKGFSCNGAPQSFFNLDKIHSHDWLFICEGEMDVLAMIEAGFDQAVSVPNGAVMKVVDGDIDRTNDNKFKFIWDAKKQIDKAKRIVICTDNDSAGQAMGEEIARRIGKDRCFKVLYPEGCKDANDVLLKHGVKGIEDMISSCYPWPVAGLFDASHFYDSLDEIYENGFGRGASTGYSNVDELYTVVAGQLTVVTGHPSSGKSEFVDQIMVNLARTGDWQFAVCSFENEPRLHIAKLISKYIGKPFFIGGDQRMTPEEKEQGKQFVQSNFSFLYQADGSLSTIDSIIERLKIAVMRHGVRGAVIDPYNYIERPRDVSETEWVSEMLTKLRVFAQAHEIHLWFVAHPAKMQRDGSGNVPPPKGYDISGSAAWFAKADVGMTVHRPDPTMSNESDIHIWKCRFQWVGKQGKASLDYDTISCTYTQRKQPSATYSALSAPRSQDIDIPF